VASDFITAQDRVYKVYLTMVAPTSAPTLPKSSKDEEPPEKKAPDDPRDMTKTPPIAAGKTKGKRRKSGKKPADMPRRPLSGYNYFFSDEKNRILEEQSKVKDDKQDIFTTLGRKVADRWKKLSDEQKEKYNKLAAKDLVRYRKEMERYNETIARRNREQAERTEPESSSMNALKPTASTAADVLPSRLASAAQAPPGSFLQSPLAQYAMGGPFSVRPENPRLLNSNTGLSPLLGRLAQLRAIDAINSGRAALAQQQQASAAGLDPLLSSQYLRLGLGQLSGVPGGGATGTTNMAGLPGGTSPEALLQLPYASSSQVNSLLAAALGRSLAAPQGLDPSLIPHLSSLGSPNTLMRQLSPQQSQNVRDESIQQAYTNLLQRQQNERDALFRQLRDQGPPPGGSPS
jgi:hypothetical protein